MESIESAGLFAKEDQPQQTMSITPIPAIDCIFIINLPFQVFSVIIRKLSVFVFIACISYFGDMKNKRWISLLPVPILIPSCFPCQYSFQQLPMHFVSSIHL